MESAVTRMKRARASAPGILRFAAAALALVIAGIFPCRNAAAGSPPQPPPPGLAPGPPSTMSPAEVKVVSLSPPPAEEYAGDSLYQFIVHHATTHYNSATGSIVGGLLRWRGGRAETVCSATVGLSPADNDYVSMRVRAVAAFVGAPVYFGSSCKPNVQILFISDSRQVMQRVLKWAAGSVGVRFPHQEEKELEVETSHAIQGWYVTAAGGSTVLNRDPSLIGGITLEGLWPRVIPTSANVNGSTRSILSVILVVDTSKAAGIPIRTIADYLALVSLSMIESPDHCDPLPSILDLISPECTSREKPTGLTAGDLAFLKALYYHDTGIGSTLSREDIVINMRKQFQGS